MPQTNMKSFQIRSTEVRGKDLQAVPSNYDRHLKRKVINCLFFFWADCGHLTGSDVKLMRSSGKILQAAALGAGINKPHAKVIISKVTSVDCGF